MKITDTNCVKYVAVEIICNNSNSAKDIECGLFIGITTRVMDDDTTSQFIILATTCNTIKIYNLEDYGIITIELVDDMTRFTSVFKNTIGDFNKAMSTLRFIVDNMREEGRTLKNDLDNELIDTDTYSEYEHWILSDGSNLNGYGTPSSVNDTEKHFPAPFDRQDAKKPGLFLIERKRELAKKETLDLMYNTVKSLSSFKIAIPICELDIQSYEDRLLREKTDEERLLDRADVYDDDIYNTHGLY